MNAATPALDMKKVKEILDENAHLKLQVEKLKRKIKENKFAEEIETLQMVNIMLGERLLRFEAMENQNIKDEIERNRKEDLRNAKIQVNVDAHKSFGIPIKKPNEEFGTITTNIISGHQNILWVNCKPANRYSYDSAMRRGRDYDYGSKPIAPPYLPTGHNVLWVPSTGMITHVFTKDQVNLPINLSEIYKY